MSSHKHGEIRVVPTKVHVVNRRAPDTLDNAAPPQSELSLTQYDSAFAGIIGTNPTHCLVLSSADSSRNPFFHAGCVYLPSHNELFTTSKPLRSTSSSVPVALISRIKIAYDETSGDIASVEWQKLRPPPSMPMPASGTLVPSKPSPDGRPGTETILFCSQGTLTAGTGGIYLMPRGEPPIPCATNYYGRSFNSPYAAAVHPDWSVWFTDPPIGHEAEFRGDPELPSQIYRYDPGTGEVRAMADGFQKPVGIAIDADRKRVYVADSGAGDFAPAGQSEGAIAFFQAIQGGVKEAPSTGTATVFAFDLTEVDGSPFLSNRRMFCFARNGVPAQLMCDKAGNVWAACGDGVEIWSAGGKLLGVVEVPGGATSFCRGKQGDLFICAGQRLWNLQLAKSEGALI